MKRIQTIIFCCLISFGAFAQTIYVNDTASGSNDGSSWINAYTDLQVALSNATSGGQIQVATGTYKPTAGTSRTVSFIMKEGVEILGGYPTGGGTRDWTANPTILSGEIGAAGNSDNSYHVISNTGLSNTAILDGFIVSDGNADGGGQNNYGGGMYNFNSSSPTILNCTFTNNAGVQGGGMWNQNSCSPIITNCIFSNNVSSSVGAGMQNQTSCSPIITNCLFVKNSGASGGGMFNAASASPTIINCTFADNTVSVNGGGMFNNNGSNPTITNCIFWDNGGANEIANAGSAPTVAYSIVQGGYTGIGNISTDPQFTDAANDDYTLNGCLSPAVEGGDGASGSSANTMATDLAGNPRFFNNETIDIGAYELQQLCCPTGSILYVDGLATGDNTGTSWTNAFASLETALSSSCPGITQIQVAAGTYKPTTGTDRTTSFVMKDDLEILGGYPTGGGTRDWTANPTILSGEIGAAGNSDNSYHVISNTGLSNTAILDGFIVSDGNADGGGQNNYGGGMYNFSNSSPTVLNCTFKNNAGVQGGGMWNQNSCSPIITNCIFLNNVSSSVGAGMQNQTSCSPIITNCLFVKNSGASGGGMFNAASCSPTIINCTFADNTVSVNGGGIFNNNGSNPTITNCILWDNGGAEIANAGSAPTVTYSIVQDGYTGIGNISTDPQFTDAANDDYTLNGCLSSAVEGGDGASGSSANTMATDLAGNPRFFNNETIDIGAYEVQQLCCPAGNVFYVDGLATGDNSGTSWANAFTSLQYALGSSCPGVTQIQVAAGTYKPTTGTDRTSSFVMKDDLEILGGYPTGGGTRDWTANPTILSGEIGAAGNSDNSYHVISNTGLSNTAILDGFIVSHGNANGAVYNLGGGMFNSVNCSPTILNCTFTNNTGDTGGCGMYNFEFSSPIITNCIFSNNVSSSSGTGAGMTNLTSSSPVVTNCLFVKNSAGIGSGMYNSGNGSPTIINCTFSDNISSSVGGGMSNGIGTTAAITNCIFWDNGDNEIWSSNSTTIVNYSIVQGGYSGTGNLDVDPQFTNPANDDYSLDDCSLAIDAGDGVAGSSANATTTDLMGNARFYNAGVIDMGAYEKQGSSSPAACSATSPLVTVAGTYTSETSSTDANGWTHYCACGELLLSLKEGGTGAVIPTNGVSLKISAPTAEYIASGGFITNPDGVVVFNRTWDVSPTTQPTSDVPVRHYFTTAEYAAVNAELTAQSFIPLTNETQMWFYKATSGTAHATIPNIPTAEVLTNGTASTTNWALGTHNSDHYAEYHVASFSGGGGGGASAGASALPVEMAYFDVIKANKTAVLNWQTLTEINNQGFYIQRSINGVDFETIAWVNGAGTTDEKQTYRFVDNELYVGINYYRLMQEDFDGKTAYSDVKSIVMKSAQDSPVSIYPNPVKEGRLTVNMEVYDNQEVSIQLYDLTGKVWLQQTASTVITQLNVNDLVVGIYLMEIAANGQTTHQKVVIE